MFREAFPGKKPETLWLLAGHDVTRHPDYWGAYPEGMALIGMEDTIPVRRINGVYFVGVFQCGDCGEFERRSGAERDGAVLDGGVVRLRRFNVADGIGEAVRERPAVDEALRILGGDRTRRTRSTRYGTGRLCRRGDTPLYR